MKKILLILSFILGFAAIGEAQLNTDRIMNMGRNALYFEDYVLSIQYFNAVISAKPYLSEPFYFRAVAKYYLDDNVGAIEDCKKALFIDPFLIGAYELRGICYQRQSDFVNAANDFALGLKYDQRNTNLMLNLGITYMADKKPEQAITYFEQAIAVKGNYMNAFLSRGAAYLEIGDTAKALMDYDKALKINPYHMPSYARRAHLHLQMKAYDKAQSDYDMALSMEPDNAGLHIARGVVRYHQNDLNGSIADYDMAIKLDKNSSAAYYNRAMLRAYIGDDNRAIEDYSVVLQLEPDNNFALLNRALLYVQLGNNYAAINDLTRIIAQYSEFPVAYYARSEAYAALGDKAAAEKDYATAYMLEQENRQKDNSSGANVTVQSDNAAREADDKNIKGYKRIVFSDDEDEKKSKYESSIRGKVQDQNINVNIDPDFYLSFYESKSELDLQSYYLQVLEDYNRMKNGQKLYLRNDNLALSRDDINAEFIAINALSSALETNIDPQLYFARAMHYSMVKNFSDALLDLNRAIDLNPHNQLMLYARASVRQRMIDFIRSIEAENEPESMIVNDNNILDQRNSSRIIDYDLIISDYSKILAINPQFAYAWYNKGNVMMVLKNYKAAILDYTQAIASDEKFAEAYYNRGLNYIYLGDKEKGLRDLSKAGELGIYKAYNVMKRYGN